MEKKDWHFQETLRKCKPYILENYSIKSQVVHLADEMLTKSFITMTDHQHIDETGYTAEKLNYLLNVLLKPGYEKIEEALNFLITQLNDDKRTDISEKLLETFNEVQKLPEPEKENPRELINRMHDNVFDISPREMKASLASLKQYTFVHNQNIARKIYSEERVPIVETGESSSAHVEPPIQDPAHSDTELMDACQKGDIKLVQEILLADPSSVNSTNKKKETALIISCMNPNVEIVRALLKCEDIKVNIKDDHGCNALMYSASSGDIDVLLELLDCEKVDRYACDKNGLTFECYIFTDKMVKYMLPEEREKLQERKYFVNIKVDRSEIDWKNRRDIVECLLARQDVNHSSILKLCLRFGDEEMVKLVLGSKLRDGVTDDKDFITNIITTTNPIIVKMLDEFKIKLTDLKLETINDITTSVISHNNPEVCSILMKQLKGVNVNAALKTTLFLMSLNDAALQFILENGKLDLKKKTSDGDTVFMLSCRFGSCGLVSALIDQAGVDLTARNNSKLSCFMLSLCNSSKDVPMQILGHPQSDVHLHTCGEDSVAWLMSAIDGNAEIVPSLLSDAKEKEVKKPMRATITSSAETMAFMAACMRGEVDIVTQILRYPNFNVNFADSDGDTGLMLAAIKGHYEIAKQLLQYPGISVNAVSHNGFTALMNASQEGHVGIVRELLQHPDIKMNLQGRNGQTPLMQASANGKHEAVKVLVKLPNLDINAKNKDDMSALVQASIGGRVEVVKQLLQVPHLDVNAKGLGGITTLMWASHEGYVDIVKEVIHHPHFDVNETDRDGDTALTIASLRGRTETVKHLLQCKDIKVNAASYNGFTSLMNACQEGHVGIVKELLEHKDLELNKAGSNGQTALMQGSARGHDKVVRQLLDFPGLNVNAQTKHGESALMYASFRGHTETRGHDKVVRQLLDFPGLNVNAQNYEGVSSLMSASQQGHGKVVEQLLTHPDLDINATDDNGTNALMKASVTGNVDIVTQLVQSTDILVNAKNRGGQTALMGACMAEYVEVVKVLLLTPNIDVNGRDNFGHTALITACKVGCNDIVTELLKVGNIAINTKDLMGMTALFHANFSGHIDVVAQLVAALQLSGEEINLNEDMIGGQPSDMVKAQINECAQQ